MGKEDIQSGSAERPFPPVEQSVESIKAVLSRLLTWAQNNRPDDWVKVELVDDEAEEPVPDEPAVVITFHTKRMMQFMRGEPVTGASSVWTVQITWEFSKEIREDEFLMDAQGVLRCISTTRPQRMDRFGVSEAEGGNSIPFNLEETEFLIENPDVLARRVQNQLASDLGGQTVAKMPVASPRDAHRLAGALALPFVVEKMDAFVGGGKHTR